MKKNILCFVLLLLTFSLFSCSKVSGESNKVSLVAVGDNLIHHTIYKAAYHHQYDFKPIYKDIKPYIKQFDLAFINQETILGGSEIGLSTYPRFNSPYEVGDALVDAGFNLISLANNHTLDRGEEAIQNSIQYWKKQPVTYSGSEIKSKSPIKIFTVNHIRFAFVAYTYGTNGIPVPEGKDYLVNVFTYEKAEKQLKGIKNKVDVVIVSMHWGNEYHHIPSEEQKEQANFLSCLGVDIILGHHPHVIQPYDVILNQGKKTYVIYSLGNVLSDQLGIDRLIGMAFSIEINKLKNTSVVINNPKAKLLYTYKSNDQFKILFSDQINQQILADYKQQFENKKKLIQTFNSNIIVY